ncbi:MAG: phosphoglucomutase/phosphomannomutase family protein [Candidatus Kapaibacteriales bacterium]
MSQTIKFGTDGWRALIANTFTFDNVALVAKATSKYVKKTFKNGSSNLVVIGYDTRFLSAEFAAKVAVVLASTGIKVILSDGISSTPMVSYATLKEKADLGIVITASHNPAVYSGYKVKASFGGPATPKQIAGIEKELNKLIEKNSDGKLAIAEKDFGDLENDGLIEYKDLSKAYLAYIKKRIDITAIKKSGLKIIYDPMYGAGIKTLERLLPGITILHNEHNPGFGEIDHPEPIDECLGVLMNEIKKGSYDVGLATDGDADRLGLYDEKGRFVDSHRLFMIMLTYLYEHKKMKGEVAKTVSLTTMVNKFCEKNGLHLYQTPIGFKYIADLMSTKDILVGGEESGGLSTKLHIPERDGIFNGLFILEIMAKRGMKLSELSDELDKNYGKHRYRRRDVRVTKQLQKKVVATFDKEPKEIGDFIVKSIDRTDGWKFFFDDGSWLLVRASGTEPLFRFYCEANSIKKVNDILDTAMGYVGIGS